jgi:hypothetical protein
MKTIRILLICTLLNILFFVFAGFYFFAKNLSDPVSSKTSIPLESFPIYKLLETGEVDLNIINIFMYSLVAAVPIYFSLKLFSQLVTKKLINKGNL